MAKKAIAKKKTATPAKTEVVSAVKESNIPENFINPPEAKPEETVQEKEVHAKAAPVRTRIADTVVEMSGTNVSVSDIEKAVKLAVSKSGLKGEINIYINASEKTAYYTVNGEGSEDMKVDLSAL